jgi:hypothetical protein
MQNNNGSIKTNSFKTTIDQKAFLQSEDPQIRLLSCLIILRTINQGLIYFKN